MSKFTIGPTDDVEVSINDKRRGQRSRGVVGGLVDDTHELSRLAKESELQPFPQTLDRGGSVLPQRPPRMQDGDGGECCVDIDIDVAKATVGPVRVQVVYCAECSDVRETVVIGE